jgi:hypothetical protein
MSRPRRAVTRMALMGLVLGAAAAGCAVGPDYTPPSTELVAFHNLADLSASGSR